MIRRGVIATVGLVVIAAVTVGLSRLEPAAPSVDRRTLWLDSVKRGSMLRQVRGVGTLVSEDILVVPALVSGRVTHIRVLPGAIVDADTVILELSNPDLERELLDATSQLNSAKARLSAQRTNLQDQLLGNEASLAQYQASCDEARLRAEVNQKQFEQDLIPELELTLSNTNAERAARLLEINQRRFEMFEKETVPAQLAELQESVRQAESLCELKRRQIESLKVKAGTNGVLAQIKDKIEPGQAQHRVYCALPGSILSRSLLSVALTYAAAPLPRTDALPRCETSKSPTESRTAACSLRTPVYSSGISQPPNSAWICSCTAAVIRSTFGGNRSGAYS